MTVLIRFVFLLIMVISFCSTAGLAPWTPQPVYNPLGIGIPSAYYPPVPPPLYNPGPGNLAPSYSYTQPITQSNNNAQQSSSTLLNQNARNVIAKWRELVLNNPGTPDKIIGTDTSIDADRNALNIALNTPGLTPDQLNNIGQIQVLLDLALVRWINSQIPKAQQYFPTARSAALEGTRSKINSTWYVDKRNRLSSLLQKFQDFLNKNPQYSQNPPSLLVGMIETLIKGQESLTQYQQFCNCFDHPELQSCAELAHSSQTNVNNQVQNQWQQQYPDQDQYDQDDLSQDDQFS